MRKVLFYLLFMVVGILYTNAQVGIGTSKPRGALDINNPITNNTGLVLPRNIDANTIETPSGTSVEVGTIVFDITDNCVKMFSNTEEWVCLNEKINANSLREDEKIKTDIEQ